MAYVYTLTNAAVTGTDPAGTDLVSLGDDNIRSFKSAMTERINSRFVDVNSDPWIIKSPVAGTGNTQSLIPTTDNTYVLGEAARRFATVSAVSFLGTIGTAAQPNITSLGALTTLTVNGGLAMLADSAIAATKKLFLDGGSDTYIWEGAANAVTIVAGATNSATFTSTGVTSATFTGNLAGTVLTAIQSNIASVGSVFTIGQPVGNDRTLSFSDAANTFALKFTTSAGGQRLSILDGALSERLTVFGTGQVTIATQVIVSANAGDLILGNAKSLRSVTIAGNDTIRLIEANASNQVVIASGGQTTLIGGLFSIVAGQKLNLDTIGDTYIQELAANVMTFVVGGTEYLRITGATALMQVSLADVAIAATKKFFLDGGGDTYIVESAANTVQIIRGGIAALVLDSNATFEGAVVLKPTQKLYLDNGGDTYIYESSANRMDMYVGGGNALALLTTLVSCGAAQDFTVQPTKKVFFDSGSDSYIYEVAANNITVVTGGTSSAAFTSAGISSSFSGNLTGDVIGNLTGTILTAAQGNITSLGTLSSLTVTNNVTLSAGNLVLSGGAAVIQIGGNTVVGPRAAGWATPTGGSDRTALTDAASLLVVNQHLQALIRDLRGHGLI